MNTVRRLTFTLGLVLLIGGCGEDSPAAPETPDPPDPPDPPAPSLPRYDSRPTLAVGPRGGCQIRETSDRCWGVNSLGGFGNGMQSTDWSYPVDPGWTQDFALLTMGTDFTCGMTTDGEGYCWGFNRDGLGVDAPLGVVPTPTRLPASEPWSYMEALVSRACGVSESGEGFCWGRNRSGEVGDSTTENRNVPTLVGGGHTWYTISPGSSHTCGVDTDEGLWCWGAWSLGNGTTAGSASPVLVSGGHRWARLRAVGSSIGATCGITTTEEAFCWGPADDGQIGSGLVYGTGGEELVPRKVAGNLSWTSLSTPRWSPSVGRPSERTYCVGGRPVRWSVPSLPGRRSRSWAPPRNGRRVGFVSLWSPRSGSLPPSGTPPPPCRSWRWEEGAHTCGSWSGVPCRRGWP